MNEAQIRKAFEENARYFEPGMYSIVVNDKVYCDEDPAMVFQKMNKAIKQAKKRGEEVKVETPVSY